MRELGTSVLPGRRKPSEIDHARLLGCSVVRLFPAANLGGASYVRAVSAVFGDVQFIPTGIDAQTVDDYLAPSSVLAVGGTWMTPPALISGGRYDEIEILAAAAPTAGTRQLAQENH